jgi:photosystem II stability/assembly factor-like uncharacterized protein
MGLSWRYARLLVPLLAVVLFAALYAAQAVAVSRSALAASVGGFTLHAAAFTDDLHGWVVGGAAAGGASDGFVMATADGGQTWSQQAVPQGSGDLESIVFVNGLSGWAAGGTDASGHATLLATSDGGRTWNALAIPSPTVAVNDVYFVDGRNGWLAGETGQGADGKVRGQLLSTHDGGRTWMADGGSLTAMRLLKVRFADREHGIGVARGGAVISTTDGGRSWRALPATGLLELEALAYPTPSRAVVGGLRAGTGGATQGAILTSSDGGQTWLPSQLPATMPLVTDLSFSTAMTGFAVGASSDSTILTTADGGASWSIAAAPTAPGVLQRIVALRRADHAVAVGWQFESGSYAPLVVDVASSRSSARPLTVRPQAAAAGIAGVAEGAGRGSGEPVRPNPAGVPWLVILLLGVAGVAVASGLFLRRRRRSRLQWMPLLAAGVVAFGLVAPAPINVLADTALVNGDAWLAGHGATAFQNTYACCGTRSYLPAGSNGDTVPNHSGNGINIGISYQCVELAQRTYYVNGWYNDRFGVNCASEILGWAGNHNMVAHNNGDGTVPVPGDMIIMSGGDLCYQLPDTTKVGHVAVVDTVPAGGSTVNAVEQNWSTTGRATFNRSGTNGSVLVRPGTSYTVLGYVHSPANPITMLPPLTSLVNLLPADPGRTIPTIVRPGSSLYQWWINNGSGPTNWGLSGDIPVPADYDGTGHSEIAVWRPSTGQWWVNGSLRATWGQSGDIPLPADYDGVGHAEFAVWRPSNGGWYVLNSGIYGTVWGQSGDVPLPADYDGVGHAQLAMWRPSSGKWFVYGGSIYDLAWGQNGDVPVPGDYDGVGHMQLAVWRPSTGKWFVYGGSIYDLAWGQNGDWPVPGDYDGVGHAQPATWRPSTGEWWVYGGSGPAVWGYSSDLPARGHF